MIISFRAVCCECNFEGKEVSEIMDIPDTQESCPNCGIPCSVEIIRIVSQIRTIRILTPKN